MEGHGFVQMDLDALTKACIDGLSAELTYPPEALKAISARFEPLRRGPRVEEATRELLLFAYFLHEKKHAPEAAKALIEIAKTAVAALASSGRSFAEVLNTSAAQGRLKALGLTESPSAKANKTTGGMSLLELLTKM